MLRHLHSIPGLIVALVVTVIAATGAMLAVLPAWEHARSAGSSSAISVAGLAEAVAEKYPGVERIERKPSGAVVVYYFEGDVPGADVVDPRTGDKIEPYEPSGFARTVTQLHRSFFAGNAGRVTAGVGAAAMLLLSITGIMLLASRLGGWRKLFSPIRGDGIRRWHAELGRLALPGLTVSALTGLYMSLATFGMISDGSDAEPDFPDAVAGTEAMAISDIAPLKATSIDNLRELRFPYQGDLNDAFTLTTADGMGYVDQATGELLNYMPNGMVKTVYETIFMLHTGQGLWWFALLLGPSALAVPFFAATGVLIWWRRRAATPKIADNHGAQSADTVILVGSEGNTTWGFAKTLHEALTAAGHKVHTGAMNDLAKSYKHAERMFVLAATYGDGAAPASARQFLDKLEAITTAPAFPVAVLGFGDRQFPRFCGFARDVEEALVAKGWRQFAPIATIDRQSAQEFARWGDEIGQRIGTPLSLVHVAARPKTARMVLVERIDYGTKVQAPTSVLRFAAAQGERKGLLARLFRRSLPRFHAGDLVGILPPGSDLPRFYSLASSSRDGVLEICVRKQPGGLCSGYLHGLRPGDAIEAFVKPNPAFRPRRGKEPLILIGAGTGIGPLTGFIRNNSGRRPIHLYFGGRSPNSDFLYREDLRMWLTDRRLSGVRTAFSRSEERAYVQHKLAADADVLRHMISRGAQVMVCGGRDMAQGVVAALEKVLHPLGLDVGTLKEQGLYVEDVY
ncbi:PepSY domain-containing protein [Ciceribacter sp. RN22]|uniref:PepSY domain-containing protein n=1 Tax=Ciceribacter sp. RN22 TaxID=2954932 RepID=UPI00209221BB|nr:PepSY domain-containing protein [Ciceribacter sp. RN22]MCO6179103.1 PepSY domain-containing protein [Ciceribacter sp. RN22]